MKKPVAISLLVILAYAQLGYFGTFAIHQWLLKEEAREAWIAAQPDRCFFRVQLTAVNAAGHWTEPGRECWYHDHLYDVIRRNTEGGIVWLYCMDDDREAALIRQSGEMTHANQDNPEKKSSHSLTIRIGDWIAEANSLYAHRSPIPVRHHQRFRPCSLCVGYTDIVAPPPKM